MRKFLLTIAAVCLATTLMATEHPNLDSLYQVLDRAIDSSQIYLRRKTEKIASLKQELKRAADDDQRYIWAKHIYQEYIPFENDSAIAYQYLCMDLAKRLGSEAKYQEALIDLADQLTESGFYEEARRHFSHVQTAVLTDSMQTIYLRGLYHLYGEMGYYSHDPRQQQEFFAESAKLLDSLQTRLDSTSVAWLQLRTMALSGSQKPREAETYCDRWEKLCPPASRAWATMAYYRSVIYGQLDNTEMQRAWLVESALVDIRNAIMDQGSLWSLAEALMNEHTDIDRAHRYIDFSWQCLSRFSTHMRSWLVAPVVTRINDEYKQQLQTANHQLLGTLIAISLLAAGLLALLFYVQKKRRQLAIARNEQQETNEMLSHTNALLSDTNEQLRLAVIHLNDSNRVKDEYMGKFLSICSEYIDKLDNYRIKVNRKLKANQYNDLLRMTGSEQLKNEEVKELFDNFDAVFLHLFPNFVDEFNALLRPEEHIELADKNHLNTSLRIFALIRLGIDESSRIAEFLRYSPNSIYAYRARIKNKAAGDRNDFEQQVKEIGIQG